MQDTLGEEPNNCKPECLSSIDNEEVVSTPPSKKHRYLLRSCDKSTKGVFMELDADRYSAGVENVFYSEAKISRQEYASFPKFPIRY